MKILAFAGSNSSASINRQLVKFALTYFTEEEIELLDLNDYEMPIYKMDRERDNGIPQSAYDFAGKIDNCDLLVISLPENNRSFSTAFKNIYDWVSRMKTRSVFNDKPIFLMATSTGKRGGASVVDAAKISFPVNGGNIIETYSFPSFNHNFDTEKGEIINEELKKELEEKIKSVKKKMKELHSNTITGIDSK